MTVSNSARYKRSFASVLISSVLSTFLIIGSPLCFGAPQTSTSQTSTSQVSITIVSGSEQRTTYAAPFAKLLQVQVTDARTHKALAGVLVDFTPASGLTVSSASAITNESGFAAVTATGAAVGTSSVVAVVEGSPKTKIRFESLKVTKALITIVPANLTSTVGVVPPLNEYQLTGFMNGETPESAHVTGTALLTTVATYRSHDANYAIKGWPGTLSSPNYIFVPGFGTLVLSGTRASAVSSEVGAQEEQDADAVTPVAAEDPAAIRPALSEVATEKNKASSEQHVRSAVQTTSSAKQARPAAPAASIRLAVPSSSAVVVRQPANSSEVRTTLLPSASSTEKSSSKAIVRSTMLEHSKPALEAAVPSTRLQVSATGIKAPGSN